MRQAVTTLTTRTRGQGLVEVTEPVARWVADQGMATGLLTVFCRHTSASLVIQENADPSVRGDLGRFFKRLVPEDPALYDHILEGPDDMPAHIRSALTTVQLSIPVLEGRMALGTWQGIYLFEHRRQPHERTLALHLLGE
ncbi:secondary thiamine-phosphate synthase enzyme YjbQ [Azospirillum brasilense]|uniref:secondary thiamine-phosphate synthase enzyme YjbQ n=1 Tax=Azospirillum brasilense TaxID=192 RepID=UPI000E69AE4E|nr:secondary thiamine-phosphate synthase enzyme YjbQ [Azospirillum brasilense]NUB28025.1 YjbQ family protein [Azospirillum brasilense]NUB31010.1 YjbQ family protein [Azospirillum brasilense]RIW02424.1 YjbQ family protein [Azospirillum brasilense]